jgi:hypothetical protein
VGQHSSASGSVLLGLDGFEVLAAQVVGEWQLEVQTMATVLQMPSSLQLGTPKIGPSQAAEHR